MPNLKPLILAITCCLLFAFTAHAQWTELNSGTTQYLNSVYFTNANIGVVVGETGTIIKTTDGGTTWQFKVSGTTNHLNVVRFSSTNVGYIGGDNGVLLKTIDGGENWTPLNPGTNEHISSLSFTDNDHGLIVGNGMSGNPMFIRRTVDGGANWTNEFSGMDGMTSVHMVDANHGYVVGTVGHNHQTSDGGDTWNGIYTANYMPFEEVFHPSINLGFIVGQSSSIRRTANAGGTYSDITPDANYTGGYHGIFFTSLINGYIVGDDKRIMKTVDGGSTWTLDHEDVNSFLNLQAIHFPTAQDGYAVGDEGIILKLGTANAVEEITNSPTLQAFPNPFTHSTTIAFDNPQQQPHRLNIYNALGQLVQSIDGITSNQVMVSRGELATGNYQFTLQQAQQQVGQGQLVVE